MNGMAFGFASTSAPQPQGTSAPSFKSHQELKTALHRDLLNKIDLEKLTSLQDVRARTQVQNVILDLIGAANVPLSGAEKERICREVLHEVFGLGPLEPLLQDASITDILVNTHRQVYIERGGILELTSVSLDRKSTRLNSSHVSISYAVFCLKKKNKKK